MSVYCGGQNQGVWTNDSSNFLDQHNVYDAKAFGPYILAILCVYVFY